MAGPYSLTGTGIQAIAQPAAIIVTTTTLGHRVSQGVANPPNYRNLGMLAWGDAQGWFDVQPIRVSPQKIVLPSGCTQLGYSLLAGSVVEVAEVAPPPVLNSSLNPWDRSPTPELLGGWFSVAGGTNQTTAFSYTVPSGRILEIVKARVTVMRSAAPTTAGYAYGQIYAAGSLLSNILMSNPSVGGTAFDDLQGGPVYLLGGQTVSGDYGNTDAGGSCWVEVLMAGNLFNA